MRTALLVVAFLTIYLSFASAYQVSIDTPNSFSDEFDFDSSDSLELEREKRQLENFDDDIYPTATSQSEQEEPGFWDKIVKVALKLFSKFIEWLNS